VQIKRMGWVFKVVLPITGRTRDRLWPAVRRALKEADEAGAKAVLIFEFVVPKGQSEFGAGTTLGSAYDLADKLLLSDALGAASTVAYVPRTIQGHAVLVALACDEIIMAPEAELGPAGVDEPVITPEILGTYRGIVTRRKRGLVEVALKLVDKDRELWEVTTEEGATHFVTPDGLKELQRSQTVLKNKELLFKAGVPAALSGEKARKKGVVSALASDRRDLIRALEPLDSIVDVFAPEGGVRAVQVEFKGPVEKARGEKLRRMIQNAMRRRNANFLLVRIESTGGSPGDSIDMANFLAHDLNPDEIHTVAYIPKEARGDAVLLAMACDEIVMHGGAVLGGDPTARFAPAEIEELTRALQEIAAKKSRPWSAPAAMIDPRLEVFRCTKPGRPRPAYFSQRELDEQPDAKAWLKGAPVTAPGRPLEIWGMDAAGYLPGTRTVSGDGDLRAQYDLEREPASLEPTWVDVVVDAMASPGLRILLLVIAFAALWAELHAPGIGVPGFISLVCFALFFWSQYLGGTVGWLAVLMFVVGVGCVLVELFVLPGLGIFGLGGGVLILASLILASQTFVIPRTPSELKEFENSLMVVGGAVLGTIVAVVALNRWLPQAPLLGQIVLQPPSPQEADAIDQSAVLAHVENLAGAQGTTTTPLVPGGKAKFGNSLYDVVTEGEFVPAGASVEVVEIRGNWIIVRAAGGPT
jgi:membrane-bound ClpP family serine protease